MSQKFFKKLSALALAFMMVVGMSTDAMISYAAEPAPVAQIGTTSYTTLQDAVSAAQSGETIKLIADTEITETIVVDKKITLDLGTSTLKSTGVNAITVRAGGDLTVNADADNPGGIVSNKSAIYAAHSDSAGKKAIKINGGVFDATCTFNPYGSSGEKAQPLSVEINGGHFKKMITVYRCYYFTAKDGTFDGTFSIGSHSTCKTYFKGGLYKSKPSAIANKVFVDGVWYKENGYNRLSANDSVCEASVDSTKYRYLSEALTSAGDGKTVTVLKDVESASAGMVSLEKHVTLDLNGFAVTGTVADVEGALSVDFTTAGSELGEGAVNPVPDYELIESTSADGNVRTFTAQVFADKAKARLDGVYYASADVALARAKNGSVLELLTPSVPLLTTTKTLKKDEVLTIVYGENVVRDDAKIIAEKGYKIEVTEDGNQVVYKAVMDVSQWEARIGEDYYLTLSNAFSAVGGTEGKTIVVLKDVSSGGYQANSAAAFTLDLNGFEVKLNSSGGSKTYTFTIDDRSAEGDGVFRPSTLSHGVIEDIVGGRVITTRDISASCGEKCYCVLREDGTYETKKKMFECISGENTAFYPTYREAIEAANQGDEAVIIKIDEDVEVGESIVIEGDITIQTDKAISTTDIEGPLFDVKDGATLKIWSGTYPEDVSQWVNDDNGDVTLAPRGDGTYDVVPASDTVDVDTDNDNFADTNNDLDCDGMADVNLDGVENIDSNYNGLIDEVTVDWKQENESYKDDRIVIEKDANNNLYLKFNISFNHFDGQVWIDDQLITDFEASEGSTIIKLSGAMLETLAEGDHTVKVGFTGLENEETYVAAAFALEEKEVVNDNISPDDEDMTTDDDDAAEDDASDDKTSSDDKKNEATGNQTQSSDTVGKLDATDDKTTAEKEKADEKKSPETGDDTNMMGYGFAFITCLALAIFMMVEKRKGNRWN